ncbi:type A2 lantipeptide [Streptomyces sp. SL13]|uniref:Type A2 lantipeptide n=1 Tax=Streptantibioticus silvisoli TaxID=2705255 RepID=A0AA90H535_9ACTN|nr:type A2 lantipeptide [Streptantibioticus silvisoli]MDI5966225.1 type A2 lantipeptide [Streptantibioticus silvisoli]MDI5968975.1 type A2 lantipeptide [Streptantibioticus silvisoli]
MSDFTPQVETREIADSDLDNISGGVLGIDLNTTLAPVVGTLDGVLPVSGTLNTVTGALPTQVTGPLGL